MFAGVQEIDSHLCMQVMGRTQMNDVNICSPQKLTIVLHIPAAILLSEGFCLISIAICRGQQLCTFHRGNRLRMEGSNSPTADNGCSKCSQC
ncbi:hypothetical protein D3C80_1377760 [compost metagenome]